MTRMKHIISLAFTTLAMLVFFTACKDRDETPDGDGLAERDSVASDTLGMQRNGHSDDFANGTAMGSTIDVRLSDAGIDIPASATSGQKTFQVTNVDDKEHDFKIEGPGLAKAMEVSLQPGESQTLSVNLQSGAYEVSADGGAEKSLTVTDSGAVPPSGTQPDTTDGSARRDTSQKDQERYSQAPSQSEPAKQPSATPRKRKSARARTGQSGAANGTAASIVEINFSDFAVQIPASIKAGQKTLKVTNSGKDEHDFHIVGNGVDEKVENVKPGESKTVKVNLQPGTYQITRFVERELKVTEADDSLAVSDRGRMGETSATWKRDTTGAVDRMNGKSDAANGAVVEIRLAPAGIEFPVATMHTSKSLKITNSTSDVQRITIEGEGIEKKVVSVEPGKTEIVQIDLKPGEYKVTGSVVGKPDATRTLIIVQ